MSRNARFGTLALTLAACTATPPPAAPAPPAPALAATGTACAEAATEPTPYVPKPAYAGPAPALPSPSAYTARPVKVGDAYTVRGAVHHLHSRVHADEVIGKRISIVGYIVKTNFDAAPRCAVHKTGRGEPADCRAPVPSFSIGDDKGSADGAIEVMGWASNFAQVFTLIEAIDRAPPGQAASLTDEFWGEPLPNPLPAVGAKVKVTGTYGITFTKSAGGAAVNAQVGILTASQIEYLEPAPEKAYLPGMKPKHAGR